MNILFQRIKNKAEDLFGVDLRSLALFRICIALLIIVDLLQRISDFSAFYTTSGILPIQLIEKVYHHGDKYISVHMLNDSFKFQLTLFIIALFSSVALLIGVFTRFFTIILWFLTLSLHVRSPWYQIGGDELIRMMLFWSIFLPLNARFSIDTKFFNSFSGTRILSISSLAILLQVVLIYWVSFIAKIKSADWINGDAIYYVLSNENQATSFGQYLFQHHNLLKFLTYATLVFEVLGPLLLFSPFFTSTIRTLMIITFVFFHICIGSCLELTIFPWVSSISMIPFLPSKIWNIFPRRSGLANVYGSTIYSPISINLLASCFLLLLLSWNSSIIKPEFKLDRKVIYLAKILKFDTGWVMYSNPAHLS